MSTFLEKMTFLKFQGRSVSVNEFRLILKGILEDIISKQMINANP